jgi:hypothetical protein
MIYVFRDYEFKCKRCGAKVFLEGVGGLPHYSLCDKCRDDLKIYTRKGFKQLKKYEFCEDDEIIEFEHVGPKELNFIARSKKQWKKNMEIY